MQVGEQQMPNNGVENAAIEKRLQTTFEHLMLNNTERENGVVIILFFCQSALPEFYITL